VPYSQQYLFNAIPDTNNNAKPTNPNHHSKGNSNPINPNARYHCEYGTLNSNITTFTHSGILYPDTNRNRNPSPSPNPHPRYLTRTFVQRSGTKRRVTKRVGHERLVTS